MACDACSYALRRSILFVSAHQKAVGGDRMSNLGIRYVATVTAMVLLLALTMIVATQRTAMANPNIAKSTGQPCAKCHTAAPALNSYGKKYKESQKK
jgi:hypothetical protein